MSITEIFQLISGIISILPKILDIIKQVAGMFPKKENETEGQAAARQQSRRAAADPRIRIVLKDALGREPTGAEIDWARETAHKTGKLIKSQKRRVGKAVV